MLEISLRIKTYVDIACLFRIRKIICYSRLSGLYAEDEYKVECQYRKQTRCFFQRGFEFLCSLDLIPEVDQNCQHIQHYHSIDRFRLRASVFVIAYKDHRKYAYKTCKYCPEYCLPLFRYG